METNMIIVKKELLNKLLSKNYLDETDWEELEDSVNLLQTTLRVNYVKISQCFRGMIFILYFCYMLA